MNFAGILLRKTEIWSFWDSLRFFRMLSGSWRFSRCKLTDTSQSQGHPTPSRTWSWSLSTWTFLQARCAVSWKGKAKEKPNWKSSGRLALLLYSTSQGRLYGRGRGTVPICSPFLTRETNPIIIEFWVAFSWRLPGFELPDTSARCCSERKKFGTYSSTGSCKIRNETSGDWWILGVKSTAWRKQQTNPCLWVTLQARPLSVLNVQFGPQNMENMELSLLSLLEVWGVFLPANVCCFGLDLSQKKLWPTLKYLACTWVHYPNLSNTFAVAIIRCMFSSKISKSNSRSPKITQEPRTPIDTLRSSGRSSFSA